MTRTLFLAWQNGQTRQWYTIGRLQSVDGEFAFVYTNGATDAQRDAGFTPLSAFPDMNVTYHSAELFPLFTNRVLRPSRPDYQQFLQWLSLDKDQADPIAILARSSGQRATDFLEVFPSPERQPDGRYETRFLLHGLSHMPAAAAERAMKLQQGERLLVMWDLQNPQDRKALCLRTSEQLPKDMSLLGYCPRYLRADIFDQLTKDSDSLVVTVERVNPPPAPIQFRVLCKLQMSWPEGPGPFQGSEYQPMASRHKRLAQPLTVEVR